MRNTVSDSILRNYPTCMFATHLLFWREKHGGASATHRHGEVFARAIAKQHFDNFNMTFLRSKIKLGEQKRW